MPYKICATVHPDCRLPTRSSMADLIVTSIGREQHGGAYAKLFADGKGFTALIDSLPCVRDKLASARRSGKIERDDLETIISDLLTGQFNAPVRVMAFNTLEHWTADASELAAEANQACCGYRQRVGTRTRQNFVASHTGFAASGVLM